MIKHPDLNVAEIFEHMLDNLPTRVGGPPATDAERGEAQIELRRIVTETPDNVKIICIACDGSVPLRTAECCVCGGFVCPACVQLEGYGECHHERPTLDTGLIEDED